MFATSSPCSTHSLAARCRTSKETDRGNQPRSRGHCRTRASSYCPPRRKRERHDEPGGTGDRVNSTTENAGSCRPVSHVALRSRRYLARGKYWSPASSPTRHQRQPPRSRSLRTRVPILQSPKARAGRKPSRCRLGGLQGQLLCARSTHSVHLVITWRSSSSSRAPYGQAHAQYLQPMHLS